MDSRLNARELDIDTIPPCQLHYSHEHPYERCTAMVDGAQIQPQLLSLSCSLYPTRQASLSCLDGAGVDTTEVSKCGFRYYVRHFGNLPFMRTKND